MKIVIKQLSGSSFDLEVDASSGVPGTLMLGTCPDRPLGYARRVTGPPWRAWDW